MMILIITIKRYFRKIWYKILVDAKNAPIPTSFQFLYTILSATQTCTYIIHPRPSLYL